MIAVGNHTARAIGGSFETSTKKGTPFVKVKFEIVEGPFKGEKIDWAGYFSDTTDKNGKTVAERTLESLEYCGVNIEDEEALEALTGIAKNEVGLVVEHEEKKDDQDRGTGQKEAKVRFVNRVGGIAGNAMDDVAKRDFASSLRGHVANLKRGAASKPKAPEGGGDAAPWENG